ncbi:MAG TPA: hypothetical protein GX016_05745 [Firmicutes bacterium]|nr:hypothetical protein [Bacillota bacterium]
MKITSIKAYHLKVPLKNKYHLSKAIGTLYYTEPIVVKVMTDVGIVGFGEADPLVGFTHETPETIKCVIREILGPKLLGTNPLNIGLVVEKLDDILCDNLLSKAAFDMACYDILGKVHNTPIHSLLGGKLRDETKIMVGLGGDEPNKNAEDALNMKNEGYGTIMIKVGGLSVEQDVERVSAIRKAVDEDFPLVVDANQGWDPATAIKFAKSIEPYNIEFMEQPVPAWDIDGMAYVRSRSPIPISADEGVQSIHDAIMLIRHQAADIFSIKVVKHGGIYKTRKIMNVAEAFGIPCLMNSMIEMGITQAASQHLGAVSKNLCHIGNCYASPLRLKVDVTDYHKLVNHGVATITDQPGLGILIDEEMIDRYKVDEFML